MRTRPTRTILFIIIFFLLGGFFIISNQSLYLLNPLQTEIFLKTYFNWIGSLFENTINILGNAIKSEWLPEVN